MATFSQPTVGKFVVIDFYCSSCKKQGQWAEFYCEECQKYYCVKCIIEHGKEFVPYGIADKDMWPVPRHLLKDLHEDKHIEGVCDIRIRCAELSVQGDPDQVFRVEGKSEYDVRIPSDSNKSMGIKVILVLSDDQILVANFQNRLYLLDHQKQVVGHSDLSSTPLDICQITPHEVDVAVGLRHEVQFLSVNGGKLVNGTKFQFQHECKGIAYNQQHLYLTSGTALYKYSMSGDQLNKLYEDTSGLLGFTVCKCAVSPSGDKIFVTNRSHHKVLTLATDGSVLHTFTDPDLDRPSGIHVTDLGQVLVCGWLSETILQLDGEGKKKLATLATGRDGLCFPETVCYNRSTASIIVAQNLSNKILVFKVK